MENKHVRVFSLVGALLLLLAVTGGAALLSNSNGMFGAAPAYSQAAATLLAGGDGTAMLNAPTSSVAVLNVIRGTNSSQGAVDSSDGAVRISDFVKSSGKSYRSVLAVNYAYSGTGGTFTGVHGIATIPSQGTWIPSPGGGGDDIATGVIGEAITERSGGRVIAGNFLAATKGGATANDVQGLEVDIQTEAPVVDRYGVSIVANARGFQGGSGEDMMIRLTNKPGGALWKYGISFGSSGALFPIRHDGVLIGAPYGGTAFTGIDFGNVNFSGYVINSPAFRVRGNGNTIIGGYLQGVESPLSVMGPATSYGVVTIGAYSGSGPVLRVLRDTSPVVDGFLITRDGSATLAGSLSQNSDARLKTDVRALSSDQGLSAVLRLNPVTFTWTDTGRVGQRSQGFIAQEARSVFPNLVQVTNPTPQTPDGTLTFDYIGVIPSLVRAVQELDAKVEQDDRMCVDGECLTADDIRALLEIARSK